jgi:quercetin dioxygenase-like cupin family protein
MADQESKVGERIRMYRERLNMTVDALSEASGIPGDVIETIEEGEAYPALGILVRLSRALGQRLGTFMDDQHTPDPVIVRSSEREQSITCHKHGQTKGLRYVPLGRGKPDRHIEPFYIDVQPGADAPLSSHEGEEFIYVLNGEITLVYGNETSVLKAGDSCYYNSLVPHAVRASGDKPAAIVASVFMPL